MFVMPDEKTRLPEGLDTMPPGQELGRVLQSLDGAALSAYDRIIVLQARARQIAGLQARQYADIAALVDEIGELTDEEPLDAASCEISAALHLTRYSADVAVGLALDLRDRLPQVGAMLASGAIDQRRAAALVRATEHLDEDLAREVIERVVKEVPEWTTGEIRAELRRLCIQADPETAHQRYTRAVMEREVTAEANRDGAIDLWAQNLPTDRAAEAMDRINRIARSLNTADELRSIDQLRADVFLDLLCGVAVADGKGGTLSLIVDVATLAGLSEDPGELAGYGPVLADIARQIAEISPQATWEWALRCPQCSGIADTGTTRRRPTAAEARTVRARDRHCVFTGCRRPAKDCDLDHICDWVDTGRTSVCLLALLCTYHHIRKHRDGWTYQRLPNGDYQWTSPAGHTYLRKHRPP